MRRFYFKQKNCLEKWRELTLKQSESQSESFVTLQSSLSRICGFHQHWIEVLEYTLRKQCTQVGAGSSNPCGSRVNCNLLTLQIGTLRTQQNFWPFQDSDFWHPFLEFLDFLPNIILEGHFQIHRGGQKEQWLFLWCWLRKRSIMFCGYRCAIPL